MNKHELTQTFMQCIRDLKDVNRDVLTREYMPGIDVFVKRPTEISSLANDFEMLLAQKSLSIAKAREYMEIFALRKDAVLNLLKTPSEQKIAAHILHAIGQLTVDTIKSIPETEEHTLRAKL